MIKITPYSLALSLKTGSPLIKGLIRLLPSCQRKRIFQVVLPFIPQRDRACKRIDGLLDKITPWPERVKLINYYAPRELMLNVMMHGRGGLIQVNEIFQGGRKALEVVSLDKGPGIKDLTIEAEKSKKAYLKGRYSNVGMHHICSIPDLLEIQSQDKKFVGIKEKKSFHEVPGGRIKRGCYFRIIFYSDAFKNLPIPSVKIIID